MICGSRVRVEFSHGRGRSSRGGRGRRRSGSRSPRSKKPFSPHDVCYECGGMLLTCNILFSSIYIYIILFFINLNSLDNRQTSIFVKQGYYTKGNNLVILYCSKTLNNLSSLIKY